MKSGPSEAILLVVTVSFLAVSCGIIGGKNAAGGNYTLKEENVPPTEVLPHFEVKFSEDSDSVTFRAYFQRVGSSVRGTDLPQTIKMTNESTISVDSIPMKFAQVIDYVGDDSTSSVIACEYRAEFTHPDLSHTYSFKWISKDGKTYGAQVQIPRMIRLSTPPSSISSALPTFLISYSGSAVPASELVSLGISICGGRYPNKNFPSGAATIEIDSKNLIKGCSIVLTVDHQISRKFPYISGIDQNIDAHFITTGTEIAVE